MIECGKKKLLVDHDVRKFGRMLSLQPQSSFLYRDPGIINESADYGPHFDEDGNLIYEGDELSKVKYVLVKSIVASIDDEDTQHADDKRKFRKKLAEFLGNEYSDNEYVHMASQEHLYNFYTLKTGILKFASIAPDLFKSIRESRGISNHDYKKSLQDFMVSVGPLKSGAYFFYSNDNRFIVKFLRSTDGTVFTHILPAYAKALRDPNTLLSDTVGFYRFIHRDIIKDIKKKYYAIVVRNTFPKDIRMDVVYDLKGSTHNRNSGLDGPATALKDCDYLGRNEFLRLGPFRERFLNQLEKDTEFIARSNINDYSLLLGIRHVDKSELAGFDHTNGGWYAFEGGFPARNDDGSLHVEEGSNMVKVYYMSVIDLLTEYNQDRIDDHEKKAVNEDIKARMSNIPPLDYWKRFIHKMEVWTRPDMDNSEREFDLKKCIQQLGKKNKH